MARTLEQGKIKRIYKMDMAIAVKKESVKLTKQQLKNRIKALLKELIELNPMQVHYESGALECYFCGAEHNQYNGKVNHQDDCPYEEAKTLIAVIENEKD